MFDLEEIQSPLNKLFKERYTPNKAAIINISDKHTPNIILLIETLKYFI